MRSAREFDDFYRSPGPWRIAKATRRDRVLAALIEPHVAGKNVLELWLWRLGRSSAAWT